MMYRRIDTSYEKDETIIRKNAEYEGFIRKKAYEICK